MAASARPASAAANNMNRKPPTPTYAEIVLGWTFNCFATLSGLNTVYYAPRHHRPVHATWLRWYAYMRNIAAVLLLYVYNLLVKQYTMTTHSMHVYTVVLAMVEVDAAIVYVCLTRCKRQCRILRIATELRRLPTPKRWLTPAAERQLNRLLCTKIIIILLQVLIIIIGNALFMRSASWCYVLLKFAADLNVMGMIIGAMLSFFVLLWYIVRQLSALNARLARRSSSADAIWHIYREYSLLGELTAQLYSCYKWLIAWLLFYYCTCVIALGYNAVFIIYHRTIMYHESLMFSFATYVLYIVDLYVIDSLCERVTTLSEDASLLLRQYSEFTALQLDVRATKCCEWFALHLSWRRLRIAFCDRYAVNRSQTFFMVAQIVLHTIFIVQSDYHNLIKSKIHLLSEH